MGVTEPSVTHLRQARMFALATPVTYIHMI